MPALPTREHAPRRVRRAESGTGHTGDEPGQSSVSSTNASSSTSGSATPSPALSSPASSVLSVTTTSSHASIPIPVKNVAAAASPKSSSFSSSVSSSSSSLANTPSSSSVASSRQASSTPSTTPTATPAPHKSQQEPAASTESKPPSAPSPDQKPQDNSPASTPVTSPTGSPSFSNNSSGSQKEDSEKSEDAQPSFTITSSSSSIGTPTPRVKAADHASDESAPSLTVIQVPTVIPISVTSTNSAGKETVSVSFSSAVVASTVPSVAHVEAATTSSGAKSKIIAGVVGGLGGAILLAALAFFLCMRRRRRAAIKFDSVRPSMFIRPRTPTTPRTPKSPKTPRSITKSEMSMSQYAHDMPLSPTSTSGHSHGHGHGLGRRTTNISPKLIVQVDAPPVVGSAHSYYLNQEEGSDDPFADPLAVARARPRARLSDLSPTIRVSDATLVGEPRVLPGESGLKHSVTAGSGLKAQTGAQMEQRAPPSQDITVPSAFLTPPPALSPLTGKTNRLSNQSVAAPPSPGSDSSHGYAM